MARPSKRRSDAISQDPGSEESGSDDARGPPTGRRRLHQGQGRASRRRASIQSPAPSDADDANNTTTTTNNTNNNNNNIEDDDDDDDNDDVEQDSYESQAETLKQSLVTKVVRLALSCEFSRVPLRRSDISTKILNEGGGKGGGGGGGGGGGYGNGKRRQFKTIFEEAQKQLKHVFGMQLVEMPVKEKTSLKDRRNQATQTKAPAATSKSWMLVSVLPREYKEYSRSSGGGNRRSIVQASRAPTVNAENAYTAFYSLVVTLIYLNSNELTEQKLERYLARVNADGNTPAGSLEKTLARMMREGYIDRRRENVGGEDQVTYVVGPRGKVEVGVRGVTGLVKTVYGLGSVGFSEGPKIEEDDLDKRLARSLGLGSGAGAGVGRLERGQGPGRGQDQGSLANDNDDDDDDNDDD